MVSWSPEPPSDPSLENVSNQNGLYMPAITDSDDDDYDDDGAVQMAVAVDEGYEPISDAVDTSSDISSVLGSSDSGSDDEGADVHDASNGNSRGLQPSNLEGNGTHSPSPLSTNIWSNPSIPSPAIEMGEEQVAQVLAAMSNITLPPSAVPEWAASVPEEHWRQTLLERIQSLRKAESGQS